MSEIKQKRLQILSKLFVEQIKQKIETERLNISVKELLNKFVDYEITESGKYLEWMVKCYIGNGFLYEDLYKVKETLEVFHDNKMKLSKDKRDIQQYKTLADLWIEVKKFVEQKEDFLSTNEQKRREKELAYSETEFLYEDDNLRVVTPLTENSSKWWGKGTRWCTAADNDNMFMDYFRTAPLLIFDFKDGEKWQLWMNKDEVQFMDEDDNELSDNKIKMKWNKIQNLFEKLLDINGLFLEYIPEELRTKEFCILAVQQNGMALNFIQRELRTKEICEIAVNNNSYTLCYVPLEFKTKELCEIAVKKDGSSLWYVPYEFMTQELCEIAARYDGSVLRCVPEEFKTQKLYELAVQQNGEALEFVPEKLRTKELCELVINNIGSGLRHVPEEFRTKELCEMAVKQSGTSLIAVPDKFRTYELYKIAVQQDGTAIIYIPDKILTYELCELAVKQNKIVLLYSIPDKFKTPELYKVVNNDIIVNNNLEQYKQIFSELTQKDELKM